MVRLPISLVVRPAPIQPVPMKAPAFISLFRVVGLCLLLNAFSSPALAQSNLVVNGSFELGGVGWDWTQFSFNENQGAADGNIFVHPIGYLVQSLPTEPGRDYVLTFAYYLNTPPGVLWDEVPLTNLTVFSVFGPRWKYAYAVVHAVSNATLLRFTGSGSAAIDDVKVFWVQDPIQFVEAPANKSAYEGGSVSFFALADGPQPLEYSWSFQGTPIAGATSRTFTVTQVLPAHAGSYAVVASNAWHSVTSAPAQLQVLAPPTSPEIVSQPVGDLSPVGYAGGLSVFAVGAPTLRYQWNEDAILLPGATNSSLIFSSVQASNAGTYTVLVSNSLGTVLSLPAILTVTNTPGGGRVRFNTSSNNAPILDVDGTPISGTGFSVQAYAGATPDILRPVGAVTNCPVGMYAGFPGGLAGFARDIPDVPANQTAYVQLRAWQAAFGTSYSQARAAGGKYGFSSVWSVLLSSGGLGKQVTATSFSLRAGEPFFVAGHLAAGDRLPDGTPQYVLTGEVGGRYLVEARQPPNSWVPLLILTNTTGASVFSNTNPTSGTIQFYRARLLD